MRAKQIRYLGVSLLAGALLSGWIAWRLQQESAHTFRGGAGKSFSGSTYDPRGFERIERIAKLRESENFKDRLRSGDTSDLSWPGLAAAQVSWTWLELLQGLHTESSYQGDFSWMFSKLNTVIRNSPQKERRFVSSLGAFFYVIGRDHAGATLLFQEMVKRSSDVYHTWFWGGYHAYYNLHNSALAGDCFERAAAFPWSAPYIAALATRLKLGVDLLSSSERRQIIEKEMDPKILDKLKQARPEWFR